MKQSDIDIVDARLRELTTANPPAEGESYAILISSPAKLGTGITDDETFYVQWIPADGANLPPHELGATVDEALAELDLFFRRFPS